jgi:hypothetical protein
MGVRRRAGRKSKCPLPDSFKKLREWNEKFGTVESVLKNLGLWRLIVALLLSTAVSIWSLLKHLHGPEIVALALGVLASSLIIIVHLPEVLRPRLKVVLTPINGPAPVQLLTVENHGKTVTLRAQCKLLNRRNDPNALHQLTFRMQWDDPQKRAVKLRRGGGCNLIVAKAETIKERQIEGRPSEEDMNLIQIWGLSAEGDGGGGEEKESSRWHRGDQPPEYDLKVTIVGENHVPHVQCFTVKPGINSALEMHAIPRA